MCDTPLHVSVADAAHERAEAALGRLGEVQAALRRLSGLGDTAVLAARAARETGRLLGSDLASVAVLDRPGLLVMRGAFGTRTEAFPRLRIPTGAGIGGKILMVNRPVVVDDYAHDPSITRDFVDVVVDGEGIGGLAGVPIRDGERVLGVLYGGIRSLGYLGDRALTMLSELAEGLGPELAAALHADRRLRLGVQHERRRIALQLHDGIGQLLFGIGVAARKVRDRLPEADDDVAQELRSIEAQSSRAASYLRDVLRTLAPSTPEEALPAAVRADAEAFAERSGVPVHLVVMGEPRDLRADQETAILAVVREGLHNLEKHAGATSVILTLYFGPTAVEVVLQDDGRGLPADFAIDPIPRDGAHWGLSSLLTRVEGLGGALELIPNEDGGATLRAAIPTSGSSKPPNSP